MRQDSGELDCKNSNKISQQTNKSNFGEITKDTYGDNFQAHLLEQYKLYVQMMDKVTERRGKTNTFYISLLSSLLALLSLLVNKNNALFSEPKDIMLLVLAILGIALCYSWHISINSYKQLNSLKFKVINEIESHLPFPCYYREWEILNEYKKNQYRRLSKVEKFVPLILAIPYFCLFIYSVHSLFQIFAEQ
jgi:hypothetical protein